MLDALSPFQCMENMGALVCFTLVAVEPLHMTVQHSSASLSSSKLLEGHVSVAYQWAEWSQLLLLSLCISTRCIDMTAFFLWQTELEKDGIANAFPTLTPW